MPGLSLKTRAHRMRVSLLRSRARTVLVTPSSSLRAVIPARQRAIHKKVLFLAHADRNWHTGIHQWFQSIISLLAGWLDNPVFWIDNYRGKV